jgi:hypothetical protein
MAASKTLTPAERSVRGSLASDVSWSRTVDRTARTEPGRRAFREKFEREVDPDGVMDPVTRAKAAESARRAHYKRLSLKASKAAKARKGGAATT